jgi:hypothetical protein
MSFGQIQCIAEKINFINKYIKIEHLFLYIMDFDIVIPLGPNEVKNICTQIENVKKNVQGFRRIFVVSYDASIVLDGCTVIDETIFPFKMTYIADYFAKHYGKSNRNGWYFQQLLKLYAGQVVPDILPHYLVIDADVFFLKPISFFNDINDTSGTNNKMLQYCFTVGTEHHLPYFEHMQRLHPSFKRMSEYSGISHHMLFSTKYVIEMICMIEKYHAKSEMPFWQIFIDCVKEHLKYWPEQCESGASEYELYFNYMLQYHSDLVCSRILKWENVGSQFTLLKNLTLPSGTVESSTNLSVTDLNIDPLQGSDSNVHPNNITNAYSDLDYVSVLWYCN